MNDVIRWAATYNSFNLFLEPSQIISEKKNEMLKKHVSSLFHGDAIDNINVPRAKFSKLLLFAWK